MGSGAHPSRDPTSGPFGIGPRCRWAEVLEEDAMSTGAKSVLAHAITVMVTLMLVMVLFGDRLGLRRPPAAQILRRSREAIPPLPPAPQPIPEASQGFAAPPAGIPAQAPPPPEDLLK